MAAFKFRRDTLSNNFINTSRTDEAEKRVLFLLEEGKTPYYYMALPLLGPPGCGKTHFAHEYPRLFEREYSEKIRSLYIEVSPRRVRTNVSVDFLRAARDPDPAYGTLAQKMIRLEKLFRDNYDIIFLDEFHRLIDPDNNKIDQEAADWVTHFLSTKLCPLVIVGEYKCSAIFNNSGQFEGRSFGACLMSPFDWGVDQDRREYQRMVGAYEILTNMPHPSYLHETDIALRIYVFSRGCLRQTAQVVGSAAWVARRASSPNIRMEHLVEAADLIRVGASARLPNPFRGDKVRAVDPLPMDASEDA